MTIRVQDIVLASAEYYGLPEVDVISHRRDQRLVRARHVAAWIATRLTTYSLPQIGAAMGGRDHTTILHGVRKIDREREADPALAREIGEIADALVAAQEAIERFARRAPPTPGEIADAVLANPVRATMQVSAEGVLIMAVAIRQYEEQLTELEALAGDPERLNRLERIAGHAAELINATRDTVRNAFDDAGRADARKRQKSAFGALADALDELPSHAQPEEETSDAG